MGILERRRYILAEHESGFNRLPHVRALQCFTGGEPVGRMLRVGDRDAAEPGLRKFFERVRRRNAGRRPDCQSSRGVESAGAWLNPPLALKICNELLVGSKEDIERRAMLSLFGKEPGRAVDNLHPRARLLFKARNELAESSLQVSRCRNRD